MIFSSVRHLGVPIVILRDDLNHPIVSGNKLHKLSPNIDWALKRNISSVLSFGGPYSNHLHALAWVCKESNLNSIGVIRGELHSSLTPTLQDCQAWGMQLIASTRKEFRSYQQILEEHLSPQLLSELPNWNVLEEIPSNTLVIPEGGSTLAAIDKLASVFEMALNDPCCRNISHAICATGTGATVAGLYKAALTLHDKIGIDNNNIQVIGMQAVAEGQATIERIEHWLKPALSQLKNKLIIEPSHFGGFAKTSKEILKFIDQFEQQHQIPLDPVYNGKAMFQLFKMIEQGKFQHDDNVLFIHTGGLQGKRS